MKEINLKKIYPFLYEDDFFIEVSDEIADFFEINRKEEITFQRKKRLYERDYSFHFNPIENTVLFHASTPTELYERKLTNQQLYQAFSLLSEKQARRIYFYYFLDKTLSQIAEREGVREVAIWFSIQQGLKIMERYFKNS